MTATFDGLTSMYGLAGNPKNHLWRASLSKLKNLTSDFHILALSDSFGGGFDGSSYHYDTAVFRSMGREICSKLGKTFAGGIQLLGGDTSGVQFADNISTTGSVLGQELWLLMTGVSSVTVACADQGTRLDFVYLDTGAYNFSYTVDGGVTAHVTMTGSNTLKVKSITGLAAGSHSITFNGFAGKTYAPAAVRCWDPSVQQLHVHTGAIGGTRSNSTASGNPATNWSDNTSATGLGLVVPQILSLLSMPSVPDLVIVCAGSNDVANGVAVATAAAGLVNMRNYYPSSAPLAVGEPLVNGATTPGNQALFLSQVYSQCGSANVPVFDLDNYWGAGSPGDGNATANTDGLLSGTDLTHPLQFTQKTVGQHLAAAYLAAA